MTEVLGITASAIAVAELSAEVVKLCTTYTRGVLNARNEIDRVTRSAKSLGDLAESIKRLQDDSPRKLDTLEKVQPLLVQSYKSLEELEKLLKPGKWRTLLSRLHLQALAWPIKSQEAKEALANLYGLQHSLSVAIQVDQTYIMHNVDQKQDLDKILSAEGAVYNSYANEHNPQCLPNTRTEVLGAISQWAHDPSSQPIFWLNGMAGTGKSTISRTLANNFATMQSLGATFFFKRGEGDRAGMSKLFTTICNQLMQRVPAMAKYVQEAMQKDNTLPSRGMQEQFDKLIKIPISSLAPDVFTQPSLLIILDALDECNRMEDIKKLLELLSSNRQYGNIKLKSFLTSRPELAAREGFQDIEGKYQNLILHKVGEDVIEHDIAAFFQDELAQIRNRFNQNTASGRLSKDWPAGSDIDTLVKMAIPLFIFAATVCRFIDERRVSRPDKRLEIVLKYQTRSQKSKLGATYLPILDHMILNLDSSDRALVTDRFRQVVGPIIILASPLTISSLARLIEVSEEDIDDTVRSLHSVLDVPRFPQQPIRMFHLSFRDFLVNPEWNRKDFWIDEKEVHRQLAMKCLKMIGNPLITDFCQTRDLAKRGEALPPQQNPLSPDIQYACRYWVFHLQESAAMDDSIAAELEHFCLNSFPQWVEALGWIGEVQKCFGMVNTLQSIFTAEINKEIAESLRIWKIFLRQEVSSIESRPFRTSFLASTFSPIATILRDIYRGDMTRWPFLGPHEQNLSRKCQLMFRDHVSLIESVAFSRNGKLIALGSTDQTLTLWNAETAEHLQTLEGHSASVKSVAFSPDDRLIASASADNTVILWTAETGQHLQTLTSHSVVVDTAAIASSPDGKFVLSALDGQMSMWTVDAFGQWQTLWSHGHSNAHSRRSATSNSPSGRLVIVGPVSGDGPTLLSKSTLDTDSQIDNDKQSTSHSTSHSTVAQWSPDVIEENHRVTLGSLDISEEHHRIEHPAQITSFTLKPNGQRAVSASTDSTVVLWAGNITGELHDSRDDPGPLVSVAFSPDSKQYAVMYR